MAPIALDASALQVAGFADRGIGRYVAGYAAALARMDALTGVLLAPELPPPRGLPRGLVERGLVRWDDATTARDLTGSEEGCVYHVGAPFLHCGPSDPPALGPAEHWARSGVPRVSLLYDLIPLRAPRHYLSAPGALGRYRERARWVSEADLVLAISEYTRAEAVDLLGCPPERVVNIGAGVSPFFSEADGTDEDLWRSVFGHLVGRPYLLTVAGSDARKNTERAITALAYLTSAGHDLHLVVAGHLTPAWQRDLIALAGGAGVGPRVSFPGPVSDEMLRACYRRAELTLMPSLAEGAGLPVLESAACNTPALASSGTALAETAVTADALFDASDPESIATTVSAALADPERRAAILRAQRGLAARSTWSAVADRALQAVRGLATGRRREWTPRVAVVTSAAEASGPLLTDGVEVDLYGATGGPGGRHIPLAAFGRDVRAASYDAVVYGALTDPEVSTMARRFPGWLLVATEPDIGPALELLGTACGVLVAPEVSERTAAELRRRRFHPPVREVAAPTDSRSWKALVGALL